MPATATPASTSAHAVTMLAGRANRASATSAVPGFWFLAERVSYYIFWWYTRFTQPELNPRRVSREPLMDLTKKLTVCQNGACTSVQYKVQYGLDRGLV